MGMTMTSLVRQPGSASYAPTRGMLAHSSAFAAKISLRAHDTRSRNLAGHRDTYARPFHDTWRPRATDCADIPSSTAPPSGKVSAYSGESPIVR